jgi:ABC-type uncharacterized transport system ATPase subunit
MLVKVAPMGETVTEVNVEPGTSVGEILDIAGVNGNGRSITVNNVSADESSSVTAENSIISLANKMKGGR